MKNFWIAAIVAAVLTPSAVSFAGTAAPATGRALPPPTVAPAPAVTVAALPPARVEGCKPAVRVAYAGYGEMHRACAAPAGTAALLLSTPGARPLPR